MSMGWSVSTPVSRMATAWPSPVQPRPWAMEPPISGHAGGELRGVDAVFLDVDDFAAGLQLFEHELVGLERDEGDYSGRP